MKTLNFNVGLLGHVDSGKTSLAKVLSKVSSTAAFDKDPQAQQRGITLDLGFSSFTSSVPDHLSNSDFNLIQFTLVDCPGHASLIKTIIGGSHIIDLMLLVIDCTKGFQTQTSECLIIGEITRKKMIVVLNKIDLLEDKKSLEKLTKKVRLTLESTFFKGCPIVTASALNSNVDELMQALLKETFIPERTAGKPFLYAVDHCFAIRGKGTILTGTVLQGAVKLNDEIEIPSIALTRKVKSMEMFRKPVESAMQGDRVGICVTQFDPKTLERGLACQLNYVPLIYASILQFNKVKYFKNNITSKSVFHINVGYENITAEVILFGSLDKNPNKPVEFDIKKEYKFIPDLSEATDMESAELYALLVFSKPILVVPNSLAIGGKLDAPVNSSTCRLAFYGNVVLSSASKNYLTEFLPTLKIYKEKQKRGIVDRISNGYELVGKNMFKKETNIEKFIGMKVKLSTGEDGVIESTFGQSGKFKVRVPSKCLQYFVGGGGSAVLPKCSRRVCVQYFVQKVILVFLKRLCPDYSLNDEVSVPSKKGGLQETTVTMSSGKKKGDEVKTTPVEIFLHHKRYIYDLEKKMIQS